MSKPEKAKMRRDHLFISYATEDSIFTDWLALKLASEGYKVWYDRLKLLGGESYPIDITEAIKNRTFRVIALLSRNSIEKPNPVKERTLALNISKERGIDFLIPVNVDGLKATELDFLMSDIVYIPFNRSWFLGLSALLKKLHNINTPKYVDESRHSIFKWLSVEENPDLREEIIWSNTFPILEIPQLIKQYSITPEINLDSVAQDWIRYKENETTLWAFGPPELSHSKWLDEKIVYNIKNLEFDSHIRNIFSYLIRHSIETYCEKNGLNRYGRELYFPNNLLPNNRLNFIRYDGKKTYVKAVSERKFYYFLWDVRHQEISRYHLSPNFHVFLNLMGDPVLRLRIRVFWTDVNGYPLEAKKANRRRKSLCKDWWNYQWLSRITAVSQWIGKGDDEISLVKTDEGSLRISLNPLSYRLNVGIDETLLGKVKTEDENIIIEDEIEDDDDDPFES